ncbi:response regulator transcription factor [Duganella sp. LX20W]|uniref:Response regulator transcription factor n=2 Tax=Rugamonas TaxID=212744 RepID=A0A7W2ESG8_9BURK|nr:MULTISPECIES: response regulator transcription factor [Rugamonas]MBA5607804.1 response regulator transcription factor [Rugamonas fusca]MBA5637699.1 response regulator transcription factor [Rugamonas brunnea]
MHCLVIEDETDTARYICKGLREAGYTVTACATGQEGLDYAIGAEWDIIVMDRMLPGGIDGLAIVERLRALGKQTPVIIVSALTNIEQRVSGLRGGADDYLSKPFAFSELLARIEALLRRAVPGQDGTQLQVADLKLDLRAMRATRDGRAIALQPREYRLLEYLMRHEGQVVTRTMLLEAVWDYHFDPQTNVIDVQISRLRTKIDKDFPTALIHTLRGIGYCLSARPPEAGHA